MNDLISTQSSVQFKGYPSPPPTTLAIRMNCTPNLFIFYLISVRFYVRHRKVEESDKTTIHDGHVTRDWAVFRPFLLIEHMIYNSWEGKRERERALLHISDFMYYSAHFLKHVRGKSLQLIKPEAGMKGLRTYIAGNCRLSLCRHTTNIVFVLLLIVMQNWKKNWNTEISITFVLFGFTRCYDKSWYIEKS